VGVYCIYIYVYVYVYEQIQMICKQRTTGIQICIYKVEQFVNTDLYEYIYIYMHIQS